MIKETLRYGYKKNIGIGDLFNGILSIVALNNRDTPNQEKIEIYVPEDRLEIIDFFSYYGVTRAENIDDKFLGLHVMDFMPNKSSYYFWDYFTGRSLKSKDLEISYLLDGKVSNLVSSNDIIIFPSSSSAELIDPSVFLHLAENDESSGKILWNVDPHGIYRNNIPVNSNVLNLSLTDLIVTILVKKPKLILQRSGICDILYHVLKEYSNTITVLYNINDNIQMAWQFGFRIKFDQFEVPQEFQDYNNKRNFKEILYDPSKGILYL